ncbi:AEC family transporter [Enterococcus olivae]
MIAAQLVFQQLILMAVLISISWLLTKKRMLDVSGAKQMSTILLYVIVPALIVSSFQREWSASEFYGLLLAASLAVIYHFLGMLVSKFYHENSYENSIHRLAVVYSNCGFMAFPILYTLYGTDGIFFGGVFVAVFNIFLWSHGISHFQEGKKLSLKKLILNPGIFPVIIGVLLFVLQISLPTSMNRLLSMLSAVNTPLAMFVIGIYLAPVKLRPLLNDTIIWRTTGFRLLLLPLLFFLVISAVLSYFISEEYQKVVEIITICGACPVASSIILIPSSLGKDGELGAKLVFFTTICSLVTIPMIVYLIQIF